MHSPKAVLFDLGGTVLPERAFVPAAWVAKLREFVGPGALPAGDEAERLAAELIREARRHGETGLVQLRADACLRHLHDRLGITLGLGPEEVELAFWQTTERVAPEPGVGEVLADLAARNVPLGVVSNTMFTERVLRWELSRHGLEGFFRIVLGSADYGFRKPHPAMFRTAVARLGLPPHEVWFVGDSFPNDVAGASGAGLRTAWYNPSGSPPPAGPVTPDVELRHWADWPKVFRA